MSGGIVRVENDGLANQIDGEFMAADLVREDAEVVSGVGMVGLCGQDLAVKRLGLRQAAALMVFQSSCEGFLSCHCREDGFSAHHRCHMMRYAVSTLRAKRGASINGDACIRGRNAARNSARRGRSRAHSAAM